MKSVFLAALALTASPAGAGTLKAVPAKLNPAKAYVLIELRIEKGQYDPMSPHGLVLARYDPARVDVKGLGRAAANPVPAKTAVTERLSNRPLVRTEAGRLFLLEVDPDTWVVQGWGDTSFSLGSYAFTLTPGVVTDLGVATAARDYAEGQGPVQTGDIMKMALLGGFAKRPNVAPMRLTFRPRDGGDIAIPTKLPSDSVRPVAFVADARFGNYLGGPVNRIEGVYARANGKAAELPSQ